MFEVLDVYKFYYTAAVCVVRVVVVVSGAEADYQARYVRTVGED